MTQPIALSATGIKDFLQCPLKFKFRYDPDVPNMSNDYSKLGSAVHKALELAILQISGHQGFPRPEDYEYAFKVFMDTATEMGLENMEFYSEGREIIAKVLDNFDPQEKLFAVEHRFTLETPEGVPITGSIDKIVEIDEDTLAIIDYKTSRVSLSGDELRNDIQLGMYDLAASLLWPQYSKRILILDYVRLGRKLVQERTPEQQRLFREFLVSVWERIKKLHQEDKVEGRLNKLCGWCDYKEYCNVYATFLKRPDLALPPLTDMDDAEFLDHWETVAKCKEEVDKYRAIVENRQRELKLVAIEKAHRGEALSDDKRELLWTQQGRTEYDVREVAALLPEEALFDVLSVHKGRLDKYAEGDPELKEKLAQIAKVSYIAPRFKIRYIEEQPEESGATQDDEG